MLEAGPGHRKFQPKMQTTNIHGPESTDEPSNTVTYIQETHGSGWHGMGSLVLQKDTHTALHSGAIQPRVHTTKQVHKALEYACDDDGAQLIEKQNMDTHLPMSCKKQKDMQVTQTMKVLRANTRGTDPMSIP